MKHSAIYIPLLIMVMLLGIVIALPAVARTEEMKPVSPLEASSAKAAFTNSTSNRKSGSVQSADSSVKLIGVALHPPAPDRAPGEEVMAGLGDRLDVRVSNLPRLLDEAEGQKQNIVLFLDGIPIRGVYPETLDPAANELRFHLRRIDTSKESKDAWLSLLGSPSKLSRQVPISIGLENGQAKPTTQKIILIVIKLKRILAWSIPILLIVVVFFINARKGPMLRTYGPTSPYSLALTQMAFWTFLVIGSFILIWLITGELASITDSVLTLLGISTGTALGGRLVDGNKMNQASNLSAKISFLKDQLKKLGEKKAAITDQTPEITDLDKEIKLTAENLAEAERRLGETRVVQRKTVSKGFIDDIISDENGYSLQRFQMAAWTIVLGVIFMSNVYRNLAMPDFSATLLALMGISSGTYLGFKFTESKGDPHDS